jgi:hypothetical protein
MAAHSLTIARQLLAIRDDEQLIRQAESALNAPGMDLGAAAGRIVATAACPVASGPDGLRLLWCEEHNVHYVAGGGRWVAHSSDHCRGGEQLASCETFYKAKINASCAGRGKRCAFHDYTLTVVDGRATFVRRDAAASATGGDS